MLIGKNLQSDSCTGKIICSMGRGIKMQTFITAQFQHLIASVSLGFAIGILNSSKCKIKRLGNKCIVFPVLPAKTQQKQKQHYRCKKKKGSWRLKNLRLLHTLSIQSA